MPVDTHCLPSGVLGTGELSVPQISASVMAQSVPGGSKRGVVVLCHGLFLGPEPSPYPITDIVSVVGDSLYLTLTNALVADGWVVIFPPFQEDQSHQASSFPNSPSYAIQNDITNDTGNGSRYQASTLHWWDHVVEWINVNYGAWPIVPFGISWGGWRAYTVAANRTSNVIAYGAHCAITILTDVSSAFTAPANWTALTTTGANVGSNALNAVTATPGFIGYSSTDSVVGTTDLPALITAASGAGCPITTLEDTTNNHGLYTTDIGPGGSGYTGTTIMDWFTATVDPLAPKVH
jgi:hypothetical protein